MDKITKKCEIPTRFVTFFIYKQIHKIFVCCVLQWYVTGAKLFKLDHKMLLLNRITNQYIML